MNNGPMTTMIPKVVRAALLAGILAAAAVAVTSAPCSAELGIPSRPLTLEECTAIALSRNPQITSSQQGVVGARAGLTRTRSSYYPQLSLSAVEGLTSRTSFLSLGGGTFAFGGTDTREDLDLVVRQTLWRRGRKESVEESKTSLRAAELDHASTIQGLVEQVARDYYAVLAAGELVAVAEAGVESARSHREQVKARVALGATADVEVFPAEDDLARAELDLIDARSNVRLALARLKNSMGIRPQIDLELAPAPLPEEEGIPTLDRAVREAIESRPEVLAARASVRGSGSALKQAQIRRGPVADVIGQYTQGYTDWEARDSAWSLLLNVSWPLFDGYATKADETAARASLQRAEADLQRTANQVALEVENALVEVEGTWERVEASAKSVAAAEARLAAAEGKYRQGVGILLEVIDARVAVTDARASRVRAQYDYQIALVGLKRALGTLPAGKATTGQSRD